MSHVHLDKNFVTCHHIPPTVDSFMIGTMPGNIRPVISKYSSKSPTNVLSQFAPILRGRLPPSLYLTTIQSKLIARFRAMSHDSTSFLFSTSASSFLRINKMTSQLYAMLSDQLKCSVPILLTSLT